MNRDGPPQNKAPRRVWFWCHRAGARCAIAAQDDNGNWHIFVADREVGIVGTREAAELLIDKLASAVDRGRRGK